MNANINPALAPLAVDIKTLRPDPRNARTHGERNISSIMESLMKYGQQKPVVVVRDGTVVAGNGTLEAAKRLGWTTLAVVEFHHDKKHAGAYALADNRTAELAQWNFKELSSQLSLFENQMELGILWTEEEAANLKQTDFTPAPAKETDTTMIALEKINFTYEQYATVKRAVEACKKFVGHDEWTDGQVIELICEKYLIS